MIGINRNAGGLSDQVYRQFKQLILEGRLQPGDRLLPSRVQAEEIGVSRNTILEAYEQLAAEGFVTPRQGSGHFVADVPRPDPARGPRDDAPSLRSSSVAARVSEIPTAYLRRHRREGSRYEFLYGEPSYEDFPQEAWARALGKVARRLKPVHLSYPDFQGQPELRGAVASYLGRARGIRCTAENVLIVHGTQEAIALTCQLLIDPGDPVICERPFYRGFLKAALAAGADLQFVPVDDQGLDTRRLPDDGKLAFITPSHQFPTGAVLPVGRRLELLAWARAKNAVIFEDDYDGEFRYAGSPVDSLKSLDDHDKVIYVGTVSKTFFPALRLGWMVISDEIMEQLLKLRAISDTTPPTTEQLAFAWFVESGQFERHIFRVRKRYAEKRRRLLHTLESGLGKNVEIKGSDAGIHVLVRIPALPAAHVPTLLERCLERGVRVHSSDIYHRNAPAFAELVIGYNAVPVDDIEIGAGIIAEEVLSMLDDVS